MILYALKCENDHEFEAWFKSGDEFSTQVKKGWVSCALCGSTKVEKALMAPAVSTSRKKEARTKRSALAKSGGKSVQEMEKYMAAMAKHVEENFDYVGDDFSEEARKIHYGEAEDRHIYGEATGADVRELIEEGIEIAPLPMPKKKRKSARLN